MDRPLGVRNANLARVLRLVHVDGPLSRATLTELTGLNRSTIADLVGDLAKLGLVRERAPEPIGRVGRPSPIVHADPSVIAIAVNPEVDAVSVAAVALDRTIPLRARIEVAHPVTPEETASLVSAQIDQWRIGPLAETRIIALGIAVPGLVRATDGLVRNAPHLHWQDAAIGTMLSEAAGLPTFVGNDANLGVIAEHLFGAARGADDVVYLNGGASGIGGGLIVGGVAVGGAHGYAGEFGQNRPSISALADRQAQQGTLEDEISRGRLLDAVGLASADEATLATALMTSSATAVRDEMARQRRLLATALANAVNVLSPSVVVLGGFLATIANDDPHGLAADVRRQAMPEVCEGLEIRVAMLAEDRLLVGAAEVAFTDLLRDPTS